MNAAIADVITAIEKASRGAEVRQKIADALTELNKNALPAVTAEDAGKALVVGPDGNWTVGEVGGDTLKAMVEGTLTSYEGTATQICANAFYKYKPLKNASFPNVTTIGNSAFFLSGVENVSAPNATYLETGCFGNTPLKRAEFPNVTSVGSQVFAFCSYLEEVSLPMLEDMGGNWMFDECTNLTSVNLPNLKILGNSAFEYCSKLATITLPSLESMGNSVFSYCSRLTDIYLPNNVMATLNNGTLGSSVNPTVHVPTDLVAAYQSDSVWGRYNIVAL